jgi:hypothetical protein
MFIPNSFQATGSFAVPASYHKSGGKETSFSLFNRFPACRLIFDEAQDFIVYCFPAGFAEMNAHPVGGGADSLGEYSRFTRLLLFYRCRLHLPAPFHMIKLVYGSVPVGVICLRGRLCLFLLPCAQGAKKAGVRVKPPPCAKLARKPAVYAAFQSLKRYITPAVLSHPRGGGGFAGGYGTVFAVCLPAVDRKFPAAAPAGFERFAAEYGFQRRIEWQHRVLEPFAQRTARKCDGEHVTGPVQWQASALIVVIGALGYDQPAYSLLLSGGQFPVLIAHGFPPFRSVCNLLFVQTNYIPSLIGEKTGGKRNLF